MTMLTMDLAPTIGDPKVIRAQAGDLEAFNDLVREHERFVYSLCYRILGSREPAEDAAQETFIAVWRHIAGVNPASFRSWLYRVASNTAKTYVRKQKRRAETVLEAAAEREASDPSPETRALRREVKEDVALALSKLPLDQRQAVILWHEAGLSYDEIARVMGTSVGTVKSRIFRGRKHLHDILAASV